MRSAILLFTLVASYHALVIRQRIPICPEVDGEDSIYFPSFENCSQFYQCTNGFAQIHDCPAGLFFDVILNVCNYAEDEDSTNCASHLLTQEPTKPSTQAPTESPTEAPTQAPTEPPTKPTTQAPTEPPTEPSTQAPTEPPTEPTTQAPTEPPTEPSTKPSTKPTEPPTTVDWLAGKCPPVDGEFAVHIPHPTDCTLFYKCNRGTPVLQSCPIGLWFNAALEVCDNPIDSGCVPK